jgi:type I restriction enzyme S subunit
MNSKRKNKISECCDILDNLRVPINDEIRQTMQGNIPYYGANGIQGYIDKYIFDEDLILLAEDGGNFEEYHTRPIAYKISGKSWVNNHAHILRAKPEFNQDFIFYSLVHKDITKYLNSGTRSKLNKSELEKIEIDFPATKDEEDKIAKILSTADAVIEKTQAAIAKYKAIKQGMLQDLFTRGIDVNTNKLRPRFEDAPELYKESKLGMIPREWDVDVMDTYVSFLRSGLSRLLSDEDIGIPVMISGNIQESRFDFSNLKYWYIDDPQGADTNSYKLTIGDILICFINSLDQIGKSAIFEGFKRDVIYTTNLLRMQASKNTNSRFLFYLLNSSITQNELHTIVKPAVNQASFTTKDFLKIPVPLVPETEQNVMAEKLTTIDKTIDAEQTYLQKMQSLKKGLMEDLLSGRKQVKINEATTV